MIYYRKTLFGSGPKLTAVQTYNHDRPNIGSGGITPKQKLALAVPAFTFSLC